MKCTPINTINWVILVEATYTKLPNLKQIVDAILNFECWCRFRMEQSFLFTWIGVYGVWSLGVCACAYISVCVCVCLFDSVYTSVWLRMECVLVILEKKKFVCLFVTVRESFVWCLWYYMWTMCTRFAVRCSIFAEFIIFGSVL